MKRKENLEDSDNDYDYDYDEQLFGQELWSKSDRERAVVNEK